MLRTTTSGMMDLSVIAFNGEPLLREKVAREMTVEELRQTLGRMFRSKEA